MTVVSETSSVQYHGNGTTDTFPIPFEYQEAAHIRVSVDGVDLEFKDDYYPSGASVELLIPPPDGSLVKVYRRVPVDQPFTLTAGRFPREELERALDRLVMLIQQGLHEAQAVLTVLADPSAGPFTIEPPVPGKVLVGGADGRSFIHRDLSTVHGSVVSLPVSIANGGTGATTASAARAALGLGSAALLDAGTAEGSVPVLGASGKLAATTLPLVASNASGALPAFGTANNSVYVSGEGWVPGFQSLTLLGTASATGQGTSVQVNVLTDAWDNYDAFVVELDGFYLAAANSGLKLRFFLGSSWQTGSVYSYAMGGHEVGGGFQGAGAPLTGLVTAIPLLRTTDIGPITAAGSLTGQLRIRNLRKVHTDLPILVGGQVGATYDSGTLWGGFITGRVSGSYGAFRGIEISSEDATAIAGGTIRIYGENARG